MSNFDGDNDSMSNDYPEIKEDIHIFKNAFYINPCNLHSSLSNTALDISHNTKTCSDKKDENQKSSEHSKTPALSVQALNEAINNLNLEGRWKIVETPQGLIVAFTRKEESQDVFEKFDIAKVLKSPVQVATLPQQCQHQQQLIYQENQRRDAHQQQMMMPQIHGSCGECTYIQNRMSNYFNGQCMCPRANQESMGRSRWMLVRDVPWSIPIKDIRHALEMQGIHISAIERWRQHIRIEIKSPSQYEYLQLEGLNFYGVSRFFVTAERWNNSNTNNSSTTDSSHHISGTGSSDEVLQCYRCQGFWHVALNCRHIPRCVRCGEPHAVEYCVRPRNNPICCNCSGPHHAAYKGCPIRKQMSQAAPVFFTLSKYLPEKCSAPLTPNLNSKEPRCWL